MLDDYFVLHTSSILAIYILTIYKEKKSSVVVITIHTVVILCFDLQVWPMTLQGQIGEYLDNCVRFILEFCHRHMGNHYRLSFHAMAFDLA